MAAVYNENNPVAAYILRHMIKIGVIADGAVDERSIKDVRAEDYREFTQVHWFAGGGFWSIAARQAGWHDERPIWTASCPCQPFSQAGKGGGHNDPRHLWPDLFRIVSAARSAGFGPTCMVGEQVAGKAGYDWFNGIRTDLATEGYSARSVDFPACAVNAPHKRNRQYWVALADSKGIGQGFGRNINNICETNERPDRELRSVPTIANVSTNDLFGPLGDNGSIRRQEAFGKSGDGPSPDRQGSTDSIERAYCTDSVNYWSDAEWLVCHDNKARRTKPGLRFLVDGLPGRVDLWSIGGNAIVPEAAKLVIEALREVLDDA